MGLSGQKGPDKANMSLLSELLKENKPIKLKRPVSRSSGKSTVQKRREKFIARIDEQITVVKADIAGKDHGITIKNKEGKIVPKNVKRWYWEDNGTFWFELSAGVSAMKFQHGANATQVGSKKALITAFEEAKTAVEAGEFDAILESR